METETFELIQPILGMTPYVLIEAEKDDDGELLMALGLAHDEQADRSSKQKAAAELGKRRPIRGGQ